MTARVVQVSGERLSEFLEQPRGPLTRIEVVSAPRLWGPLKPLLARFVRAYRDSGAVLPTFSGVPLCLFGSEWPGFPSSPRSTAPLGRCIDCNACAACGFAPEVPDELLPISAAPLQQRWNDYCVAFGRVTGSDMAVASMPILEKIVAAYHGPVSLEPSVLVTDCIDPSLRFVVFPHRAGDGAAARNQYETVLASVDDILTEVGSKRVTALLEALSRLPPSPVPVGLEGSDGAWRVKMYVRIEGADAAQKQALLDALAPFAPGMHEVPLAELQMIGLVLDENGLHTVKAYVAARPSHPLAGLPEALAADHPLVALTADRALATLDIWCRGAARADKWDFNLRDHYLAGPAVERLLSEIASAQAAAAIRPLLIGPTYRADVVAVGVRAQTRALYMELN